LLYTQENITKLQRLTFLLVFREV